jgi:DNA invertase Pin-like site-specific DNA recombinase
MAFSANQKLKAYSYIRWSSDRQTSGDSFERQIRKTREICRQRGWDLDESMKVDEGVSAYRGDNLSKGSLGRFIQSVDNGRVATPCVLVVEAFDRLTRARLRESRKLFDNLLERGVLICTANNGKVYDETCLDNPVDLIISLTELNAGHEYAKVIGERSRSAWERRKRLAREGKIVTRKLPAWIECPSQATRTTEFRVIEDKAQIVRRIFSEYLAGIGSRTISVQLSRERVKPFGRAKLWNVSSVFKLLKSRAVIGEYQPQSHFGKMVRKDDGPVVPDYYPSILDKKIFYQVQEMLRRQLVPRGPRQNCYSLFTGIAECSRCGSKMALKTGAISKYKKTPSITLVCSNAWRGGDCHYNTIRYKMIEDGVLSVLASNLIKNISSEDGGYAKRIALQGELASISEQLARLTEACSVASKNEKTPQAIFNRMNVLEERENQLNKELETLTNRPDPQNFVEVIRKWKPLNSTTEHRRRMQIVLKSLISKLSIDADKRTAVLHTFSSDKPVHLRWNENRPDEVYIGKKRMICSSRIFDDGEVKIYPMTCTLIRGDRVKFLGITDSDLVGRSWEPVVINGERLLCVRIRIKSSTIYREHLPRFPNAKTKRPRYFRLQEVHMDKFFHCPDPRRWAKVAR